MLIVLSNLTEGKPMTVVEAVDLDEVTATPSAGETAPRRLAADERIAAAVEAAYILEAVRK